MVQPRLPAPCPPPAYASPRVLATANYVEETLDSTPHPVRAMDRWDWYSLLATTYPYVADEDREEVCLILERRWRRPANPTPGSPKQPPQTPPARP